MDRSLAAILEEMALSIAALTQERSLNARRMNEVEERLRRFRSLAIKIAQVDRRVAKLERMVKN